MRFLIYGNREFGANGESFLGRPDTVTRGISKVRNGQGLEEAALDLLYREARSDESVREELVAWACGGLLRRGNARLRRALQVFPQVMHTPLDAHLLGEHVDFFTSGTFPGPEALVDRLAFILEQTCPNIVVRPFSHAGESILAMVFQPHFDREILRRVLLDQQPAEIAESMGISKLQACRESTRVLRNARRRARNRHTNS